MLDPCTRDAIQSRAVELLRCYLPALKPQGRQWVTQCPFHDDTIPSFVVSPEKGVFHCHGCKVGGDLLTFVQRFTGLSFADALTEVTRKLGIALPARTAVDPHLARLTTTAETVTDLFTNWLWHAIGTPARRYLQERGITEDTARRFRLGFHPDHPTLLLTALAQRECDLDTARQLGVVTQKHGHWLPLLRGRLIFPICNRTGTVHGFGARVLTDTPPKYLNSPASLLFRKGRLLYGLPHAIPALQHTQRAIIVEGYLDVLTLHQAGFPQAVAPMAATLTAEQLRLLRSLAPQITLLFDGDRAGHDATLRTLVPILDAGLQAEVVRLPSGSDPDAFLRGQGVAALQDLLTHAVPLTRFAFETWQTQSTSGAALRHLLAVVEQLSDPVARLSLVHEGEHHFRLPPGTLTEAAGMGTAARQQLEDLLCGLLLTVPEVRTRLQRHRLPFSQPALREIAAAALRQRSCPPPLTAEAQRVASLVGRRHDHTRRHPPARTPHSTRPKVIHSK
jgi:DNA primase catalytic core